MNRNPNHPSVEPRTVSDERLHKGKLRNRKDPTIEITVRITLLLWEEERRKITTDPRLPKVKPNNGPEQNAVIFNKGSHRSPQRGKSILENGHPMGIQ